MDVELTGVEEREYRARDQRPERLTPKDSPMFTVRRSLVGILVKKSPHYESPLFVFPRLVCLTGVKQTRRTTQKGSQNSQPCLKTVFTSSGAARFRLGVGPQQETFVDRESGLQA